jgi:hypothetical protein
VGTVVTSQAQEAAVRHFFAPDQPVVTATTA